MYRHTAAGLDAYITGNWGEDQFADDEEEATMKAVDVSQAPVNWHEQETVPYLDTAGFWWDMVVQRADTGAWRVVIYHGGLRHLGVAYSTETCPDADTACLMAITTIKYSGVVRG